MDKMEKKKIHQIIGENYTHASVLYFFGISFYDYSDKTLEQVCREKGLDLPTVIRNLEAPPTNPFAHDIALQQYPVDLIIEYLKHSHYIFIKQKLPYISKLIHSLDSQRTDKISKDLKFIFPFFVEDFIRHIYEEEDTLFSYISTLYTALQNKQNISRVYFSMERHSINDYALKHTMDDDEMLGIRQLTCNYTSLDPEDLHMKVILEELNAFDSELQKHAKVENEILFPKALALENEVSIKFKAWIPNN